MYSCLAVVLHAKQAHFKMGIYVEKKLTEEGFECRLFQMLV